jgi:hypothetical protein
MDRLIANSAPNSWIDCVYDPFDGAYPGRFLDEVSCDLYNSLMDLIADNYDHASPEDYSDMVKCIKYLLTVFRRFCNPPHKDAYLQVLINDPQRKQLILFNRF